MKKIAAATAALSLAGGLFFGTVAPAFADDSTTPVEETTTTEVAVPTTSVVETPVAEVPVVHAPEAPVKASVTVVEAPSFIKYEVYQEWWAPRPATVQEPFKVAQTTKALTCNGIKQSDFYWITSTEMEAHYKALITKGNLNSPGEDSEFSPHNYTVIDLPKCEEPPVVTNSVCTTYADGGTSTNLNANGWVSTDTRATGHAEYVVGGLKVYTESNTSSDKVAWGHAASGSMSHTGVVGMDYTSNFGIRPGIQLSYNFGADGSGTLVQEDIYGTGTNQDLWLTNSSSAAVKANAPVNGGGNGSQWHGTINQWLAKYPTAQLTGIGFSGGSGVYFSGTIHSITVGCTTYKFDKAAIVVPVKPADIVKTTVVNGTPDCKTNTFPITTTTTTTGYSLVDNVWVATKPVVADVFTSGTATAEQCPVAVIAPPKTDIPVSVDKPVTAPVVHVAADKGLAYTGFDALPYLVGGFALAFLGILAKLTAVRIRKLDK